MSRAATATAVRLLSDDAQRAKAIAAVSVTVSPITTQGSCCRRSSLAIRMGCVRKVGEGAVESLRWTQSATRWLVKQDVFEIILCITVRLVLADVGELAVALAHVEAIAHYEVGRDLEAHVAQV